jgi:BirA family biotin operon repressor/biotin-[acetyl-CoA-carboxylase] ligase
LKGLETGLESVPALWLLETGSTNAEARRRAEAGEAGPLWIAAHRQTGGRGRQGRTWEAGRGNLAATLLLSTSRAPAEATQLSFVVGLAVREFAAAYVPESLVRLKWPNDVLLAGRKLSGVLIESGRRQGGDLWMAVGVGINLAEAPTGVEPPPAALASHLKAGVLEPPAPVAALEALSRILVRRISAWSRSGFAAVRDEWAAAAAGLGAPCVARPGSGEVRGLAEGLDVDGALLLRLDSGELRRITAGDVFFGGP